MRYALNRWDGFTLFDDARIAIDNNAAERAKLSGLNPKACLTDILGRIRTHDPGHLDELLPWNRQAYRDATPTVA